MELDHLKGFYHVAKLGSFTEAAQRLYVTQPAISLQVKALEKEVGEPLFDRVGRKVRLTHAGEVIFKQAEDLLSKLEDLKATVRELKDLERGRLALGASDTTSIYFLPCLLKSYREAHPGVEVGIKSLVSPQIIRMVLDHELDVGIVTLSESQLDLEVLPLFAEKLVCVVSPEHPFRAMKVVTAEDLAVEPLILLEKTSNTRHRVDAFLSQAGATPRPVMELSNFEIIKRYVAAGHGVSLVPGAAVARERDGVCAVPLSPELSIQVSAVFRRERTLPYPARAFLAMARERYRIPSAALAPLATPRAHLESPTRLLEN